MRDPGDGSVHTASTISMLTYAGQGLWSRCDDVQNVHAYSEMMRGWSTGGGEARHARRRGHRLPPGAHRLSWPTALTRRDHPVAGRAAGRGRAGRSPVELPVAGRAVDQPWRSPSPRRSSLSRPRRPHQPSESSGFLGGLPEADGGQLLLDHPERHRAASGPCGRACPTRRRMALSRSRAPHRAELGRAPAPGPPPPRRRGRPRRAPRGRPRRRCPCDAAPGQGPAGQPAAGLALLDPLAGERGVVDQPDLLEPVEQAGGDVVGHVACRPAWSASSERVRARPVSWSSRILRATDSGSASGPVSSSGGGSRARPVGPARLREARRAPCAPTGG